MLNYQPDFAACRRIEALLCWDGNNHADIVYAADTAGVTIPDRLAFEPGTRGQNGGSLAAQPAWRVPVSESTRIQSRVVWCQIQLISHATGVGVPARRSVLGRCAVAQR